MVSLSKKYLWEEYRKFGEGHAHDYADFDTYHKVRGLKWPVVDGKETQWRFNAKYDPYARKAGTGVFAFYGKALKAIPEGDLKGPKSKEKESHWEIKAKILFPGPILLDWLPWKLAWIKDIPLLGLGNKVKKE